MNGRLPNRRKADFRFLVSAAVFSMLTTFGISDLAGAKEKPNIPTKGMITSPPNAATMMEPTIGPVQENDTNTMVKAIKNIPIKPP